MNKRQELLLDLLELKRPIKEIAAALSTYPWDSDSELVLLTPGGISEILRRYVDGNVTAGDVEHWANAIEGRDDIGIKPGATRAILHELANPVLTQPLTPSRATVLFAMLSHDLADQQ
jgi:hypothetical protein